MKTYRVSLSVVTGPPMGRTYTIRASRDGLAVDRALSAYKHELDLRLKKGDVFQIVVTREA